jgi:sirohydrochlorin ferrochelatase
MRCIVILGHGSRAPGASESMERVARALRLRRPERVEVAHMELSEPSLVAVLETLHSDGFRQIVLAPYFLHHGIHLREDIPAILKDALERLPGMVVEMAPHLGFDEALVDVVDRRVGQAKILELP